jgi:hypothetical protein
MGNATSPSAVEKIERCHLSRRQICHINPRMGVKTEIKVKQSIEQSIIRQHMRGTIRLNDQTDKRTKPDIHLDCCGRHLSVDTRYWTSTSARHERLYLSREFYGSQRGTDSLTTFLQDDKRFLFIAFEFAMIDPDGNRERKLIFVPGIWLHREFVLSPDTGLPVDNIIGAWSSLTFGKEKTRLYDIDMWRLIEVADTYQGRR